MRSNHVNLVSIFVETLLVSCSILGGLSNAKSQSRIADSRLSSPEECARTCHVGELSRTCYYHFTLELYSVLGKACQLCTPNVTNSLEENCQCVPADGVERSILTVNRMIPGPSIEVCKGDKVVIDVENKMEGMDVTIHWHGIFQKGYQYYDGVPFVTQCPTPQYTTFRYQWVAENAGTHFWHSHSGLQKMDGIYGSLIVREPVRSDPNRKLYDEDSSSHVMLISDWMHEQGTSRYPGFISTNTDQTPESALINGKGQYTYRNNGSTTDTPLQVFTIRRGRRYRFRMINAFCTVCPAKINIQGHRLTLIAADGESVKPVEVDSIISFAGERYDFVINANQPQDAYWIQLRALGECGTNGIQQLGILRYEEGPDKPSSEPPTYDKGLPQGVVLNPLDAICDAPRDDATCVSQLQHANPIDKGILQSQPDVKIFLPFELRFYTPEQIYRPKTYMSHLVAVGTDLVISFLDGISFEYPSAPLLSEYDEIPPETICNSDNRPVDCGVDCTCTHRIDIPLNAIVEVVLIDTTLTGYLIHPFHLHGYAFNVVGMGRFPNNNVTNITLDQVRDLDRRGLLERNWDTLPLKDTIAVPNGGYVILRFRADNPGEWLMHCHFLYHIPIGMEVIFHVGNPEDLPLIPQGFPTCGNFLPSITPVGADSG